MRFPVLLLLAAVVVVAVAVFFFLGRSERPFPQLSEIQRIDAKIDDPESGKVVTFEVPRSHWEAIFSAMLPARKDDQAAKWVMPGSLNLRLKNGNSYYVGLYSVSGDLGAFSAGPSHEWRVYYRGGNSSALEKAVADAFAASKAEHH
ncbi:MAG TPA: hypothetical protein VGP76_11425 [Planctomycetaceae bacterium]|nr:hypothetical protein [Planctomycetaceae bacterium]